MSFRPSVNLAFPIAGMAVLMIIAASPAVFAADASPANPAVRASVERGLKYLASKQQANGGFLPPGAEMVSSGELSIVSLTGMALLRNGTLPGSDGYARNLRAALNYVLASQQPNGLFQAGPISATRPAARLVGGMLFGMGAPAGVMYDQGFTTLFVADAYAACSKSDDAELKKLAEEIKPKLEKAVIAIECAQSKAGGWRYQVLPYDADISVTAIQYVALKTAKDAGIDVEPQVLDDAVKYVMECQTPDGGFAYMANLKLDGSSAPRSAAGLTVLRMANAPVDRIGKAAAYLQPYLPGKLRPQAESHHSYFLFYGSKAAQLAGGEEAKRWQEAAAQELTNSQLPDGHWEGDISSEYATASALLALHPANVK